MSRAFNGNKNRLAKKDACRIASLRDLAQFEVQNKRDSCFAVPFDDSDQTIGLDGLNVLSLPALGSLDHIELNLLAFLQ